ncbi:MAG: hypothetical protein MJ065_01720 [Oscillospiraceae bacterium]|nr:hypothetical protein [Oscillospiraceae bacterium]
MRAAARLASAAVAFCSAVLLLTGTAAAAGEEDVFRAMAEAGLPASFIQDTRNQFHSQPHDENGMEMNGIYRSYDEWVELIRENGAQYVWGVIAEEMLVPAEDIIAYYERKANESSAADDTVPDPDPHFAEMTLDEKREYVASLPESERAAFLANMTAEERTSLLKQLSVDKKHEVLEGMAELGREMGMTITVDDAENYRFSVRDREGRLIDTAGFGLIVDSTGWDTTVPVLTGAVMVLSALGGLLLIGYRCKKEEQTNG